MSSIWGENLSVSIFGGSHTKAIGVTVEGLPAGLRIDEEEVLAQMKRRAPGNDPSSTTRKEADLPKPVCGISPEGFLSGDPVTAFIENNSQRSKDYSKLRDIPRPGHADYAAHVKYGGYNDIRGGGHFSGRLTAGIVYAGALCRQFLKTQGIYIGAHASQIAGVDDEKFDPAHISADELLELSQEYFPVRSQKKKDEMHERIRQALAAGDSVGGTVTCAAVGLKAGYGSPMFGSIESKLASFMFAVPAVKGIEFGAGFQSALMTGSENNDCFYSDNGEVFTRSNNSGGILGGISNGMPIIFTVAFKPTPSVSATQETLNLKTGEVHEFSVGGRHDPCIVPRAVPVVEAAAAIVLADILLEPKRRMEDFNV